MAFQTGSANDVYDLLSQLRSFIATLGWTENAWNGTDTLQVSNGTSYWNLKAVDNVDANSASISDFDAAHPGIVVKGSTGFDGGSAWDAQPNDPGTDTALGVFTETDVPFYWFFGDAGYVHVVARIRAERYTHLQLGDLVKIGTWTGGQYLAGTVIAADDGNADALSFSGSFRDGSATIRADIDGLTNAWQNTGGGGSTRFCRGAFEAAAQAGNLMGHLAAAAPNDWNGRSPMWPLLMMLDRTGSADSYSIAGYPADMRYLNIRFIEPEETVVVGADEWLVFPHMIKTQNDFGGFAYRKVS